MTSTREYDRFGPWIDEVLDLADVPALFRPFAPDVATARLVLKVPRPIARRDATPRMDLYDHLLLVADSTFTVLTRRPGIRRRGAPEPAATVDTWQVVQPLKSGLGGVLLRLWLRTFPTELQGAVVLMDDVALEVLSRHAWVLRDSMPVTSIVRTMLPRSAVLGVEVAASARLRDVVEVTLSVPGHAIALALPQGSPAADLFQRAAG